LKKKKLSQGRGESTYHATTCQNLHISLQIQDAVFRYESEVDKYLVTVLAGSLTVEKILVFQKKKYQNIPISFELLKGKILLFIDNNFSLCPGAFLFLSSFGNTKGSIFLFC